MSVPSPRVRKVVIPAAGRCTRLLPATKSQPKEMLPVARKPTIQYVVEEMVGAGLSHILIVSGRSKRAIDDHFDPDTSLQAELSRKQNAELLEQLAFERLDVHYFYARQSEPRPGARRPPRRGVCRRRAVRRCPGRLDHLAR